MIKRVGAGGKRITFGHLNALSGLGGTDAVKHRTKLEKAILEEGLSVRALEKAIKAILGSRTTSDTPGRNVRVAKDVLSGLSDMTSSTKKLVNRIPAWDKGVFVRVAAGQGVTKKTAPQLEAAKKVMDAAIEKLTAVSVRLGEAITQAKRVIAQPNRPAPVKKKVVAPKKKVAKKKVVKKVQKRVSAAARIQAARRKRRPGQ